MKTAKFLSVSAFLVLAGLFTQIGCSTPAVGEVDDNESAASADDDDDDDDDSASNKKPKKKATDDADDDDDSAGPTNTKPAPETDPETDPGTDPETDPGTDPETDPGGGGDECMACVGTTGPAAKYLACLDQNQCADNDDACFENCFQTGCGGSEEACSKLDECDAQCFGPAQ